MQGFLPWGAIQNVCPLLTRSQLKKTKSDSTKAHPDEPRDLVCFFTERELGTGQWRVGDAKVVTLESLCPAWMMAFPWLQNVQNVEIPTLASFFLASIFQYPLSPPPLRASATGSGRDVGISGVASVTLSILSGREHQQPTNSVSESLASCGRCSNEDGSWYARRIVLCTNVMAGCDGCSAHMDYVCSSLQ